MTIGKLAKMPYAQARIIHNDDGSIDLISYSTRVASIDPQGWLSVYGLYSMTTRRHISAFVWETMIFPNGEHATYQLAKQCYDDSVSFNIYTGEIKGR